MPDRLTPEEIESAKKLCAEATPGPWVNAPDTAAGKVWVSSKGSPLAEPESPRSWFGRGAEALRLFAMRYEGPPFDAGNASDIRWEIQKANAAFVAASRTLLPRALAEIESLRAQAERDRAVIEGMRKRAEIDAPLIREANNLSTCPDCTCHREYRGAGCRALEDLVDDLFAAGRSIRFIARRLGMKPLTVEDMIRRHYDSSRYFGAESVNTAIHRVFVYTDPAAGALPRRRK